MGGAIEQLPAFRRNRHSNLRLVDDWTPQQISAFRRMARQSSTLRELASKTGYCTKALADCVRYLEIPFAANQQIIILAPKTDDAEGAHLMDRIDGRIARRQMVIHQRRSQQLAKVNAIQQAEQRRLARLIRKGPVTVTRIIALAEQFYDLPPGSIKSGSRNAGIVKARHAALKVARRLITHITLVRLGQLAGGLDHSTVKRTLRKPDEPFQAFIDHAGKVLS